MSLCAAIFALRNYEIRSPLALAKPNGFNMITLRDKFDSAQQANDLMLSKLNQSKKKLQYHFGDYYSSLSDQNSAMGSVSFDIDHL